MNFMSIVLTKQHRTHNHVNVCMEKLEEVNRTDCKN